MANKQMNGGNIRSSDKDIPLSEQCTPLYGRMHLSVLCGCGKLCFAIIIELLIFFRLFGILCFIDKAHQASFNRIDRLCSIE